MHASNDPGERIALQPENRREELILFRLFSAVEPPDCWFTLDVEAYRGLDDELARKAAHEGPFAPGTRALILTAPHVAPEFDWEAMSFEGPDE